MPALKYRGCACFNHEHNTINRSYFRAGGKWKFCKYVKNTKQAWARPVYMHWHLQGKGQNKKKILS